MRNQPQFHSIKFLQQAFPQVPVEKLAALRSAVLETNKEKLNQLLDENGVGQDLEVYGFMPTSFRGRAVLALGDVVLGSHGVEYLGGGVYYCNTGDTYDRTLLYDGRDCKFRIGSWGDLVERDPRRFEL